MTIFKRDGEEELLTSSSVAAIQKEQTTLLRDFSQSVRSIKCSSLLLEMWKVREYIIRGVLIVIPPCTRLKRYHQESVWNCDSHCLFRLLVHVFSFQASAFSYMTSRVSYLGMRMLWRAITYEHKEREI